jgi:hypothetical protein
MHKPILQSLILADHVYEDKLTGKRIIAGIFNRIIRGVRVLREVTPPSPAPQLPYTPPVQPSAPAIQPQQPIQVQPPPAIQPAEPIQVHSGQSYPAAPPVPPSQPAAPASDYNQPAAVPQPAQPAAVGQSIPAAPPTPAQPTDFNPVPPQAPPTPPQAPPAPPLQPGQRVLEIPPTGLQSGSPFAYLSLTEVRGRTPLMLQLVNLQDDTQLFRSDLLVECNNPLYTIEMTVPLPPIAPPQAGIYALELLYNNELLGSLRIVVEDAAQ